MAAPQVIPLFPLPLVLLPAMPLPLHIFEERYKELIADVSAAAEAGEEGSEFGVVLVKDEGIINIGCTASVHTVMRRYDDGRLDLLAIGQRRFRIVGLNEEKSYLQAEIEFFEDVDLADVPEDLKRRAGEVLHQLLVLEGRAEAKAAGTRLSFQIAHLMNDTDKRQTILALRSESERLEYLVRAVPSYISQQEQIALAKRTAPLNGHAKRAGTGHDSH